jgi:hypothetical protein
MPAHFLIIATLLTIALPLIVCIGIFFDALPWRIDRRVRSDRSMQERLRSPSRYAFATCTMPQR